MILVNNDIARRIVGQRVSLVPARCFDIKRLYVEEVVAMKLAAAKRIRRIHRVLLILIIVSLFVTGCEQLGIKIPGRDKDTVSSGVESGFKPSSSDEMNPFHCAYKSDKTEFDINDVTLDFYYGVSYYESAEYFRENIWDIPYFEVSFTTDDNKKFVVKRVEENLVSEKYRCEYIRDENLKIIEIKYNYCETLTIPAEIFTEESGVIYFGFRGDNIRVQDPEHREIGGGKAIFYKVKDGKVILSSKRFE